MVQIVCSVYQPYVKGNYSASNVLYTFFVKNFVHHLAYIKSLKQSLVEHLQIDRGHKNKIVKHFLVYLEEYYDLWHQIQVTQERSHDPNGTLVVVYHFNQHCLSSVMSKS